MESRSGEFFTEVAEFHLNCTGRFHLNCTGVLWDFLVFQFKSAPHISPGALCAACDPMAIQPGSGLPLKGIFFVHEALAWQPGPFPSWKIPDYSQDLSKIDAKTNKTHGFEDFTCKPLRDPHFRKKCTKWNQWDHSPEAIFPTTGRENLPPCFQR